MGEKADTGIFPGDSFVRRFKCTVGAAALCLIGAASAAHAEEPAPKGPPRVIELEAMVIEGKVAKPQVFYVLGRSRVQYQNMKMKGSFVDRIVQDARKNPF